MRYSFSLSRSLVQKEEFMDVIGPLQAVRAIDTTNLLRPLHVPEALLTPIEKKTKYIEINKNNRKQQSPDPVYMSCPSPPQHGSS